MQLVLGNNDFANNKNQIDRFVFGTLKPIGHFLRLYDLLSSRGIITTNKRFTFKETHK